MQKSILIFTIIFSFLATACRTTIQNEFRGEIKNLKRDGKREAIHSHITGTASGPYKGGFFEGFQSGDPAFSFYYFGAERIIGEKRTYDTESSNVTAWFIRGKEKFHLYDSPEQVKRNGGVDLKGKFTAYYENKSSVGHIIGVDLHAGGNDSVSIKGEFVSYNKTEFEPQYLSPVLPIFVIGAELESLFPSRQFSTYSSGEAKSETARYNLKTSGRRATITAVKSDGKPIWERAYLAAADGKCVADGEWKEYSKEGYLVERTQYQNGKVSGKHWLRLHWHKYKKKELDSYWKDRTPVGKWRIGGEDEVYILVHFAGGKEVLKELIGASSVEENLLLRKWEHGKETFTGDWVKVPAPKIAKQSVYMSRKLRPDFEPEETSLLELQQLAKKKRRE